MRSPYYEDSYREQSYQQGYQHGYSGQDKQPPDMAPEDSPVFQLQQTRRKHYFRGFKRGFNAYKRLKGGLEP